MAEENLRVITLLSESTLFRELPHEALVAIASKIRKEILPKGTVIYEKGDPGEDLYLIGSGEVALLSANGNPNEEKVIATLGDGEVFGEMSLLTGEPRSITVRLETTSELYILGKKDFETIMQENPQLALHLSRILSKRLSLTNEHILNAFKKRMVFKSKLHLVISLLQEPRNSIFNINLAVSLLEQTRRKVALIEVCSEDKSCLLESIGMSPAIAPFSTLSALPLREMLARLKQSHPSGLDIFSLPSEFFASSTEKEKSILVLNYLRSLYDHSIIIASTLNWDSVQFLTHEADQIYLTSLMEEPSREQTLERITHQIANLGQKQDKLNQITLVVDGRDSFVDFKNIRLSWARAIDRDYESRHKPFEALLETKTLRSIERVARVLGDIKIGLALGAGGALGYTICGILKVLEKEKIYPDIIAGTSIGALIGAGYAKGLSPDELIALTMSTDKHWIRDTLFWDFSLPKGGGFLGGLKLTRFLHSIFDDQHFNELELPLACVATDILTGEEVVIRDGRVIDAIRSSIAIPVVFKPFKYKNRLLVDGGLVNPVPTSALISMNADILIAIQLTNSPAERSFPVDPMGKASPPQKSVGVLDAFFRTIITMEHQIAANSTHLAHITIHPKTASYNWSDFDKARELIPLGEQAAQEALPKLKTLLPFYADYCATKLKKA